MKLIPNRKLIIVISSPSGAGKTSVCQKLIERDKNICLSVSDTTRKARDNEVDGVDYNFIEKIEFKKRIKKNVYIEYAEVFGNFYGSQKNNITKNFENNKDTLFDIDWQGASQLKNSSMANILSIFIVPPSRESIHQRLILRAEKSGDDQKAINERMKKYETEMSHREEYDYVVVNKELETCVNEIEIIINNRRKELTN